MMNHNQKKSAKWVASLTALLFLAGIGSEVLAAPRKLTLCHIPDKGKAKTRVLGKRLAERHLASHPNDFPGKCESGDFVMVAVSGTLQEGFPLRPNLDYVSPLERVDAIFLGQVLIRGLKAHLDIKDADSREFRPPEQGRNPVNPAMVASGDKNDANIYAVYLVDRRQAARALLNEPRFLSMVPDLAFADIQAEETSPALRSLVLQAIAEDQNATRTDYVTFLTVVSTWNSCHFEPSPILYTKPDGTRVTDFPNSLAKFAGVTDQLRLDNPDAYNAAVETAVRKAVADKAGCGEPPAPLPVPLAENVARYGVSKDIKRMIEAYRPCDFEEFAKRAGLDIQVPQCPN